MATITEFREEFRNDMGDPERKGNMFTSVSIDRFRKKAIRKLYARGVAQEVPNYLTVYTEMPLIGTTTMDYAMPTGWQRITSIEFWENTTNTMSAGRSALWDDRVRPGYVRVFDAPDYANYRLHLTGLKSWGDVDNTSMPDEVYECVLLGAELEASKVLANKRAANRKSLTAQDTSLGSEVLWVRELKRDYQEAIAVARKALRSPRG